MKAIIHERYGSPDILQLREIPIPTIGDDGVLVHVRAASVNPLDWHFVRGEPFFARAMMGLRRPKETGRGVDLAGEVEAVGKDVTQFRPGDAVFGGRDGAFAEYVAGRERNFSPLPAGLSFEEAAALPIAGCTALQGLRDRGRLQPGQTVLINGAAGGVGTCAVQIARALGGRVTGVCSARNVELVSSLGAEQAIDYGREDFTRGGVRYDLIVDFVGNRSLRDLRRALAPRGTLVLSGGAGGKLLGPLPLMLGALVVGRFVPQRMGSFLAQVRKADLLELKALVEAGKLRPVVDRTYPLRETAEALRYLEGGHARGKTIITL